jgi:hypothetical protein
MKKCFSQILLATLSLLFTLTTYAYEERIDLRIGSELVRNERFDLQNEIYRARPDIRLHNYSLEMVEITAKSQHGRGEAALLIDGRAVDTQFVDGSPRDFDNPDYRTYRDYRLSTRGNDRGSWELDFRGNFKVRYLTITLRDNFPPPPPPRGEWIQVGQEVKAPKLIALETTYYPGRRAISEIRIFCSQETVNIIEAYYVTSSGQMQPLRELQGFIDASQSITARLNRDYIDKIVIKATSPGLNGSRGAYTVEVLQD